MYLHYLQPHLSVQPGHLHPMDRKENGDLLRNEDYKSEF